MFDKLNYITLSGERYPIKCDLLVLERLQDKFGSLNDFENKLLNWKRVETEEGKKKVIPKLPDVHAINAALCLMIEEGIDIYNETAEVKMEFLPEKALIRKVDMDFTEIAGLLHDEFAACFQSKNQKTTQEKAMKKA